MDEFKGKLIEVETNRRFFYHGIMLGHDEHFINIKDIKNGSMYINKQDIKSLKEMKRTDIILMTAKNKTFLDKLKEIDVDVISDLKKVDKMIVDDVRRDFGVKRNYDSK